MSRFAYDRAKHDEALDTESSLSQRFAILSTELNDLGADALKEGGAKSAQWNHKQAEHAQVERELRTVRAEVQRYELLEPLPSNAEPSPFARFMRSGTSGLASDEVEVFTRETTQAPPGMSGRAFVLRDEPAQAPAITAALTRSDAADWRAALPRPVYRGIVEHLAAFGGHHAAMSQFSTADGNPFAVPSMDESGIEGEILGQQNTETTTQELPDPTIVTFLAYTLSSRRCHLTREMIQDASFNIDAYARRTLMRRMGRTMAKATMDGTGAIEGLLEAAAPGVTAASATAVTADELDDLVFEVDAGYLDEPENMNFGPGAMADAGPGMGGMIGYLISRGLLKIMRQLKDGDNRPLWRFSIREGDPNTFGGYPVRVSHNLPKPATGNVPALFGNFAYHAIRNVSGIEVFSFFDSATAERNRLEYIGFSRFDSRSVGAKGTAGAVDGKCLAYRKLTMA